MDAAKSLRKLATELESVIENVSKPIEIDLTGKQFEQIENAIEEINKQGT